jgi:phospholipid/cholesterol/gamma-HCH transport system permease protein
MSTAAAPLVHLFRPGATLGRYVRAPSRVLVEIGQMISFALTAIGFIPFAIRRYPKEVLRMVAQMGMGTAELGAMRISEEIDALEVMSIRSIAFLASTRVVSGFIVIIPLYALAITLAFLSAQVTTVLLYGQSVGTYNHYFHTFLRLNDVGWSFAEVILVSVVVMTTHCYYGYHASGGPVGVGEAVGRSMRLSLITIVVVVVLTAMAVYGKNPNFNLTV